MHPVVLGPGLTVATNLVGISLSPLVPQILPVEPVAPPPDLWVTGISTDLAIRGPGFFLTADRTGWTERLMLVRQGDFRVDENGYFVSNLGFRLQGMNPDGDQRVDLRIDWSWSEADGRFRKPTPTAWNIAEDGALWKMFSDGTSNVAGRLALWMPEDPSQLVRISEWEWSDPGLKAPWSSQFRAVAETESRVWSGYLERPIPGLRVTEFPADPRLATRWSFVRLGLHAVVALDGPGYLLVRDPESGARYVTRLGLLKWDAHGRLVTALRGYRVQGRQFIDHDVHSDLYRSERPPPPLEPTPRVWLAWVVIHPDGTIARSWSDGTVTKTSTISLVRIVHPERLEEVGDGFYRVVAEAEPQPRFAAETQTQIHDGSIDPTLVSPPVQRYLETAARFLQGAVMRVGRSDSLALSGTGFFIVRDPGSERRALTRHGLFGWSSDGFLETADGWRVQATSDSNVGSLVDLQIPVDGRDDWRSRVSIQRDGEVMFTAEEGEQRPVATVVLANVPDPTVLVQMADSGDRFEWAELKGDPRAARHAWGQATTMGLGAIQVGSREIPNHMTPPPALAGRRGVHLELFGTREGSMVVERSDDLVTWRIWAEFIGGAYGWEPPEWWTLPLSATPYGTSAFDLSPPSAGARFYRLRTE